MVDTMNRRSIVPLLSAGFLTAAALTPLGCDDGALPEPATMLGEATDGGDTDTDNADDDDATPADDDGQDPPDDDDGPKPMPGDDDDGGTDDANDGGTDGGTDDGTDDTNDDGGSSVQCEPNGVSLIPSGWADASSVFEGWFSSYPADLAIDGDVSTSWFSAGSEVDGATSTYEFIMTDDHCIDELEIIGNGSHENSDFHTGFGFDSLVVEVLDTGNRVVFTGEYPLLGSPDDTQVIDVGGVLGHRVRLSYSEHESPDCGGFSELRVTGRGQL